jgi:hypothetical protein
MKLLLHTTPLAFFLTTIFFIADNPADCQVVIDRMKASRIERRHQGITNCQDRTKVAMVERKN